MSPADKSDFQHEPIAPGPFSACKSVSACVAVRKRPLSHIDSDLCPGRILSLTRASNPASATAEFDSHPHSHEIRLATELLKRLTESVGATARTYAFAGPIKKILLRRRRRSPQTCSFSAAAPRRPVLSNACAISRTRSCAIRRVRS